MQLYATPTDYALKWGTPEAIDLTHEAPPGRVTLYPGAIDRQLLVSGFAHAYGAVGTASVDWGDGSGITAATPPGAPFAHTYGQDGVYSVRATWADAPGNGQETTYHALTDVYVRNGVAEPDHCAPDGTARVEVKAPYTPRLTRALQEASTRITNALYAGGYAVPVDAAGYPDAKPGQIETANEILHNAAVNLARCELYRHDPPKEVTDACTYWTRWLGRFYMEGRVPDLAGLLPPASNDDTAGPAYIEGPSTFSETPSRDPRDVVRPFAGLQGGGDCGCDPYRPGSY